MSHELSFEPQSLESDFFPESDSFYFSPRKNISFDFLASATNDLHLLKEALLSQPTAANENRIITLSSLFHSQTLKMK